MVLIHMRTPVLELHNLSILDLTPNCSHPLCKCNPAYNASDRRNFGKCKRDIKEWMQMREIPLDFSCSSPQDIVNVIKMIAHKILKFYLRITIT